MEKLMKIKKILFIIPLAVLIVVALISSDTKDSISKSVENDSSSSNLKNSGKSLVVYFSMPETDKPTGMTKDEDNSVVVINKKVLGNTQYMAFIIQKETKSDIFRIEPKKPYPIDHDTLVDLALEEQRQDFRPKIKNSINNIEQYDIIYIGYPNWWRDMPMVLYSFLEKYDLSGKKIIPFSTHGGSGFSNTVNKIIKLQPNAEVSKNGLSISRNEIKSAKQEIIDWIEDLN